MFSDPVLPWLGQTQDISATHSIIYQHRDTKLSGEPTETKHDVIDPLRIWWAKVQITKLHSAYIAGVPSMQHLHCTFFF